MSVRLGYACISQVQRELGIYTGRTLTLESIKKHGIERARELGRENVRDLLKILQYNETKGFRFFRITSNLFPHMDNPKLQQDAGYCPVHNLQHNTNNEIQTYTIDYARNELATAGKYAREHGHRCTMHPGQFAQLGSPNPEVVAQTGRDLAQHAAILDAMGMRPELGSVMIIHGGGTFGDKPATIARWIAEFKKLPHEVSKFISLENDEFSYSVLDLLPICEELNIPLCVDYFHHSVKHAAEFDIYEPKLMQRIQRTWSRRGIKPKCHWSNQRENARPGSHSDCVKDIPAELWAVCKQYDCDIMLEVKTKDVCMEKMYKKYYTRSVINGRVEWTLK
jgi:UV DNA damage endonuclease